MKSKIQNQKPENIKLIEKFWGIARGFRPFRRRPAGFTMIDLLVSSVVIIFMLSFVLANFRTAQFSGEIDVAIKQVVDQIRIVRNLSLGGQLLDDGIFPDGGYGAYFDLNSDNRVQLYAALDQVDTSFSSGRPLANQNVIFKNISFVNLCGLTADEVTDLPCQGAWEDAGNYLEVVYSETGGATANYGQGSGFKHVGGTMTSSKTGQQAFFYVSLLSGNVTGDLYDRQDN